MMRFFWLVVVLAACAPAPQPVVFRGGLQLPAPVCALGDAMDVPVLCPGRFTRAGQFACVLCAGAAKCTDTLDMVYCAATCRDPACSVAARPASITP